MPGVAALLASLKLSEGHSAVAAESETSESTLASYQDPATSVDDVLGEEPKTDVVSDEANLLADADADDNELADEDMDEDEDDMEQGWLQNIMSTLHEPVSPGPTPSTARPSVRRRPRANPTRPSVTPRGRGRGGRRRYPVRPRPTRPNRYPVRPRPTRPTRPTRPNRYPAGGRPGGCAAQVRNWRRRFNAANRRYRNMLQQRNRFRTRHAAVQRTLRRVRALRRRDRRNFQTQRANLTRQINALTAQVQQLQAQGGGNGGNGGNAGGDGDDAGEGDDFSNDNNYV